ncbi:bHLH/Zip transcription factor [Cladophialophora chaetospira]|uniref:BHLH/Zip transcription factor n=1 Tax=Cladophialophora chaetospira TaxID=386627 RepID=A0AA38XL29_9EURO|nr:bHLH/Zip transcription factor [Cladophialophora chaetospira]
MSYSQPPPYPQYQQTLYENPQPDWSSVDFAPTTTSLEDYPQYPRTQADYSVVPLPPTSEQVTPLPDYSQYLNYDSTDLGPIAASENTIPSQQLLTTSPAVTVNPHQYVNFPIKTEPEPKDLAFPQVMNMAQSDGVLQQTCGANPLCLQILESPDMEMEDFNLGEWFPSSTISPQESQPTRKASHTASGSRRTSAGDGTSSSSTKKPRRRGRKPAINPDDEGAQARAKQAHSVVERRYRDNLNGKIMQLHRTLSSISANSKKLDALSMSEGQEQRGSRVRKSDVMTDAVNYVHQSEVEMRHMSAEIDRLTERVRTLEKLVRCEDCVLLKEMVRRSLQGHQQQQG